MFNELTHV
jgi:hypothetical protein